MANRFSISHEGEGLEHVAILREKEFGCEVRVAVGYGFNVFSFKVATDSGVADVLYAEEGFPRTDLRATANGTPILVPFPNRIAGGKFTYDGKTYTLPCNDHGVNAIHGFAFDKPWRVVEESTEVDARIAGEFEMLRDSEFTEEHWPGNFRVRCELMFAKNYLAQYFTVKNLSDKVIPFGLGTHPYFRMPLDPAAEIDRCGIDVQAEAVVELKNTLPTGRTYPVPDDLRLSQTITSNGVTGRTSVPIGDRRLDHVFSLLPTRGRKGKRQRSFSHIVADRWKDVFPLVIVGHDDDFPYVVVYIPPHRKAICVEPYTCVTNSVNFGDRLSPDGPPTGLWHLQPSEERTSMITTQVMPIDAHDQSQS
jgi:aldose 1-epimerase